MLIVSIISLIYLQSDAFKLPVVDARVTSVSYSTSLSGVLVTQDVAHSEKSNSRTSIGIVKNLSPFVSEEYISTSGYMVIKSDLSRITVANYFEMATALTPNEYSEPERKCVKLIERQGYAFQNRYKCCSRITDNLSVWVTKDRTIGQSKVPEVRRDSEGSYRLYLTDDLIEKDDEVSYIILLVDSKEETAKEVLRLRKKPLHIERKVSSEVAIDPQSKILYSCYDGLFFALQLDSFFRVTGVASKQMMCGAATFDASGLQAVAGERMRSAHPEASK
ncbi:MAG: hypothetical protein KF784_15235 [Fimbriimonadaceae bacterium]|nr:hypothetical protein [Fimbriimonadaceae bacterium]